MNEPWTPGPWELAPKRFGFAFDIKVEGTDRLATAWNEADARLIAAAPEMAEMLERVIDPLAPRESKNTLNEIRALLSRIRGEAEVSA